MGVLIRNARVLTMDDHETEHPRADILIEGSKISAVGADLPNPPKTADLHIIEASGLLAMPGLINGHIHSPGNFMKGMLDDEPLELFMLYEVPPFSNRSPSPRLNYVRTMLGIVEMLKVGVTAAHDDAFYNPIPTPEAIDGLMQAYADSGMRAAVTIDQPNVIEYEKYPFLYEILPEHLRRQMAEASRLSTKDLLALYQGLIDRWHGTSNGRLRAAVSCSAPQRVTVDYLQALSELSRKYNLPYNIHVLETKLQRVLGEIKYAKSLVRYLDDLAVLDERTMIIHSIWVDQQDIELMGQAGACVAHNPISNLKIGSGIMPFRRLRDQGIPICLGSDEASVDDTANMWQVAKTAGLIHKVASPEYESWPKASEILWALIRGGTRAMRLEGNVGILAPGYEADLILLDLNSLAFTPLNDLHRQLVFCENGTSVVLTMVAGQIVAERGRVVTVDEEAIKAEARSLMAEYLEDVTAAAKRAKEVGPYYREMYKRAAVRDVGMNRWAGPMVP